MLYPKVAQCTEFLGGTKIDRRKEKERCGRLVKTKLGAVLGKIPDLPEMRFPYRKSNDYMSMFIFHCGIGFYVFLTSSL